MPIYEEKEKINGQKRYYIRTYITDKFGNSKQITRHNKEWVGRDGYWKANQEEIRLKNHKQVENENITLKELCESYLNEIKPNVKLGTYIKHKDNIKNHILPEFINIRICNIDNKNILEWKQNIENKNLSLNFKKSLYGTFNLLFSHACKYYNLENNPVRNVGNFTSKKGHKKKKMNFMTQQQFNEFILNIDDKLYNIVFTTLFYTGMRRGELLALEWEDIDLKNNKITINKTLNPKLKDDQDNTPKTNKSNREIELLPIVNEKLTELNKKESDTPFSKVTLSTLKRKCDRACKIIGIENFRIHDFRHSFASMCIDKGVPIEVISDYLGHENITTTLDTYGHLYPHSQQKLLDKFK